MKIIDTHVHVWDLERIEYSWLKDDTSILNRTYTIEELSTYHVDAGVTQGVLVQAANNLEDTDWMLQVAENTNWIFGVVGWVPLMDPDATLEILSKKYFNNPYYKGVRHLIHNEKDPKWLLQDKVLESLKILAEYNLSYDVVGVIPGHIDTALKVAEKVPTLRMVFDHLNQPPIKSGEKFGRWGELMKEASMHDGFYAKISGLGTASGKNNGWTAADVHPYVEFIIDHFTVDRCFCGGDWPVSLLAGNYVDTWKAYQQVITTLVEADAQEKILFKNARSFYNL